MQGHELKKVHELLVDLAGGGTSRPITETCFLAQKPPIDPDHPDEAILFEADTKPTPRFTMTTKWMVPDRPNAPADQSYTAQIGGKVVPSQVVRVETVHIPSNPTTITMYPQISKGLLARIGIFEPKIRDQFLHGLQNPVTAAIFLTNVADPLPSVAVCVAHLKEEKPIWEVSQQKKADTVVVTDKRYVILTIGDQSRIELSLVASEEPACRWILASGIHIKTKVDAELAQLLAKIPQDKLNWQILSPFVEPYILLRRVFSTGLVTIF